MVGNANTLIGMGKEPAEVGFFAESESVLEMEGKRLVDFLLLRIVSLQKTMGGDDISRTDVEAKLMADQGMADAVAKLLGSPTSMALAIVAIDGRGLYLPVCRY